MAEALDLADVGEGTHLVDLGCGDGQVLIAAARRGARVTGVESDPALAQTARDALTAAGLADRGLVVVADFLADPAKLQQNLGQDLFADPPQFRKCAEVENDRRVLAGFCRNFAGEIAGVLFAYLSPGVLQRLTPWLRGLGGGRLVTVDFDVPDLVADETRGAARLYQLPGRRRPGRPSQVGWWADGAATLCVMPAGVNSLTCLTARHAGGPVRLSLRGALARHASVIVGTDATERGRPVAVDIRWRERAAGTLAQGAILVDGLPPHPLVVLFADADLGQWDLSADGHQAIGARLRRRSLPRPTTTEELLTAAEG